MSITVCPIQQLLTPLMITTIIQELRYTVIHFQTFFSQYKIKKKCYNYNKTVKLKKIR